MSKLRTLALLATISVTSSRACLWDSETIEQEYHRFPTDIHALLGAIHVRPDSFHLWRKAYSLRKIADSTKASPLDYDNLAVSLDKLQRDDSAIVVMKSKRLRYGPAYETMANMGTFHFHMGNFAEGLPYIDTALQINPDAHFGRERYQKWLVEYLLSLPARTSPMAPAKSKTKIGRTRGEHGFAAYVASKERSGRLSDSAREKAIKGVVGMMVFGNGNQPILLEAYGDLAQGRKDPLGRGLAIKAYLMASLKTKDSVSRNDFVRLAWLVPKNSKAFWNHWEDILKPQARIESAKKEGARNASDYFGRKLRQLQDTSFQLATDSLDLDSIKLITRMISFPTHDPHRYDR
ncbi:MAG: hypothetical protein IPO40_02315 [Fibrobacteres bacterium]|nr:hypothetical protein [Fibrobacterota bacterium]